MLSERQVRQWKRAMPWIMRMDQADPQTTCAAHMIDGSPINSLASRSLACLGAADKRNGMAELAKERDRVRRLLVRVIIISGLGPPRLRRLGLAAGGAAPASLAFALVVTAAMEVPGSGLAAGASPKSLQTLNDRGLHMKSRCPASPQPGGS